MTSRSYMKQTLAIFWKQNKSWLFLATCLAWLSGMLLQKLLMPLVAARAIDKLVLLAGSHQNDYWPSFVPYIISLIVIGLLAQVGVSSGLLLISRLEMRGRPALQERVFSYLTSQSLDFHNNNFAGAIVSRVSRFMSAYITVTDVFVINVLRMFANIVIAVIVISFFAPWIALFMAVWSAFFIALNIYLTRRRSPLSRAAAAADSQVTAHLADNLTNVAAVKTFASEQHELQEHSKHIKHYARARLTSWVRAIKNDIFYGLLMILLQATVLVLSIWAVMNGTVTIGILLLIQVYLTQIIVELWGLGRITRDFEIALSDAAELTELLYQPLMVQDVKHPEPFKVTKAHLQLRDVTFQHSGSGEAALFSNFNLDIKPGERVGLVGHSGSGKSTLSRLLMRFMDIDSGNITIDDQNIAEVRQTDLRKAIAYVPQEPLLFHRSLAENIAYGKSKASLQDIEKFAKLAHAHEFIKGLPQGYDTLVGERGVKLSGGQRQRVAIARAMLKDAPILILDEATSALDSESEVLIQDALWKLMEGRTSIVIAHRLSTIQKMDRIVVLDEGKIVEEGTHAQLLEKKGTYAKLWAHQSGGFLNE